MDPPRFVDPRVAKGWAKRVAEATSKFSYLKILEGPMQKAGKQWRPAMSGREAFRYMSRTLRPALEKHLVTFPLLRMEGMTMLCGLFEQRGSTGGIDFFFVIFSSSVLPRDGLIYRVEITPHAMQRIIQRTGLVDSSSVRACLFTAVANIYWFQPWIHREQWRQLGLTCEEGVFVGDVTDDLYRLRTFIPAFDNGRPSRWRTYHQEVWPMMKKRDLQNGTYDAEAASLSEWYVFADGLSKRHGFLLQEHKPGHDYLTEAWANKP